MLTLDPSQPHTNSQQLNDALKAHLWQCLCKYDSVSINYQTPGREVQVCIRLIRVSRINKRRNGTNLKGFLFPSKSRLHINVIKCED